ncbi:unnamed protein product [Effrenium voratum]|nr:unnamed protein product [Effrenium voratum]
MVAVPECMHEFLGEESTWQELSAVFLVAFVATAAQAVAYGPSSFDVPIWRYWLGLFLAADVFAGSVGNLTRGTNDHYASSARRRWAFIAVHWHLIAIFACWHAASGEEFQACLLVNVCVLVVASIVNLSPKAGGVQRFVGGVLMVCFMFSLAVLHPLSQDMMPVTVMFALKVSYCFAVDHYYGLGCDAEADYKALGA